MFLYTEKYTEFKSDLRITTYCTKYPHNAKSLSKQTNIFEAKSKTQTKQILFCYIYSLHNSYFGMFVYFVIFIYVVYFVYFIYCVFCFYISYTISISTSWTAEKHKEIEQTMQTIINTNELIENCAKYVSSLTNKRFDMLKRVARKI